MVSKNYLVVDRGEEMKKTYKKPRIKMEYFTLNQSIATSCGYKDEDYTGRPTHAEKGSCGWDDGFGEVYWTSTEAGCSGEYSEDLVIGEICYNTPNGQPMIFAS